MRRESKGLWQLLQQYLLVTILIGGGALLGYHFLRYKQILLDPLLPPGAEVGGVDVAGLTLSQIEAAIAPHYAQPVSLYHGEQRVEIDPAEVNFVIDYDLIRGQLMAEMGQKGIWEGYFDYLVTLAWGRPLTPLAVPIAATHDPSAVRGMVTTVTGFLDDPAQPPKFTQQQFVAGEAGFVTDIDASLPEVEAALYRPEERIAHLILVAQTAPELNLGWLKQAINAQINSFSGQGIIFIIDLQTGEEFGINEDVAISGLSVVKIAIVLEALRAIDVPISEDIKLINETLVNSGNFSANLLLDTVAGQDNAYLGADILTESMHRLGLENTFIVTPYEEPARPDKPTLSTPANRVPDLMTQPDPAMQTTAEDMGTLLAMIYNCANGGGALLALYPDQLTVEECQFLLDTLVLNVEGNLIRFGVPEEVPVAHKHGWNSDTHGDAGIVFSPGGDYVIVEFLHENTDWLVADITFPILREISRLTYNYYNFENPYLGDALQEADRFDEDDPYFNQDNQGE